MEPQLPHVRPVSKGAGRLTSVLVAVVGAMIILAIIKPWGAGGDPVRPNVEQPTPAPIEDPSTPPPMSRANELEGRARQCDYASGWRVYAVEESFSRRLRSWYAVEPIDASRPEERTIPYVRIAGALVTALGFCAPIDGPDMPPAGAHVRAWRLSGAQFVPFVLDPISGGDPGRRPTQALYRRPAGRTGPAVAWPAGRYVFRVTEGTIGGYDRWYGVELIGEPERARPTLEPRPGPASRPG